MDIKLTNENLATTKRGRDVVFYKMHGCVSQPQDAVITKDDYESYESMRPLFVGSLKGDLISKTFLFLGFSFTDPNIDYILSRVRVLLGTNVREHFCIMKSMKPPPKPKGRSTADYEYEHRKLRKVQLFTFVYIRREANSMHSHSSFSTANPRKISSVYFFGLSLIYLLRSQSVCWEQLF